MQKNNIMNKKERKILHEVLKNLIGDLGFYLVTNENKILYTITNQKVIKNSKTETYVDFYLPSIDEIKKKIKSVYSNFDLKKLSGIEYVLEKSNFDKHIIINTDEDIIIHDCNFNNGLTIKKARKVQLTPHYYVYSRYRTLIMCSGTLNIDADELYLVDCGVSFIGRNLDESNIVFNAKEIYMSQLNLKSNRNLEINAESLNSRGCDLEAIKILINTKEINEKNNKIKASDLISINNDNCDSINNIYAPKILYNGNDVTNSEDNLLPKAREQLLKGLKELRDKCNKEIEEDTIKYQESLKKQPLVKRMSKKS